MTRRYFGQAGHFCASHKCRFHLHTHVGRVCVSTVGEYFPAPLAGLTPPREDGMEEIGFERLYETMVFALGEDGETSSWDQLDFDAYNDRDAANAGHERMVRKYEGQS